MRALCNLDKPDGVQMIQESASVLLRMIGGDAEASREQAGKLGRARALLEIVQYYAGG